MSTPPATVQRNSLRRQIRERRRQLVRGERQQCAKHLARQLRGERLVLNSRTIAVYLPADGEMDTWPLIEYLWAIGKHTFLPVLAPCAGQTLWFSSFARNDRLVINRFGILEPERPHHRRIRASALDLVFTPLVAFDPDGNRLGMGGGFYDRSFRFLKHRQFLRKPLLIGLAYDFQRVARLAPAPWDVPLYAVVTETGVYRCSHGVIRA